MTRFTQPSFSVNPSSRPADLCSEHWRDVRGKCVFCGEPIVTTEMLRPIVDSALARIRTEPVPTPATDAE